MKPRQTKARGINHGFSHYQCIKKLKTSIVPLSKPMLTEEELSEIWEVFQSGWLSKGPKAREFEQDIEDYLNVKNAIAVTNCTSALHLACLALGIKEGDQVIIPDYTFPSTGFAPQYVGAELIFCDIDPLTYNIDPGMLELLLIRHQNVKAIIVVHAFGQCADMTKIMKIAEKYKVFVIEDAACALGAKYKNQFAGTFGNVGCFSLHARKGITTGEGGIIVTNDSNLANKMRKLSEFGVLSTWAREQGVWSLPEFEQLGYNYKMSDIAAAIGVVQLRKLNWIIKQRRAASIEYREVIEEHLPFLEPVYESPDCLHIFQSYVALVKPEYKKYRNYIIQRFLDHRVQANIGTYALHREPVFLCLQPCPVSDDIFHRAIALPMFQHVGFKKIINGGKAICKELSVLMSKNSQELYISPSGNGNFSEIQAL